MAGSSTSAVQPTTGASADASTTVGGGMSAGSETSVDPSAGTDSAGDPEVMMACAAACGHIFACVMDLPGTPDDCVDGCVATWGDPSCGQAGEDFVQCLIEMNCKQLGAYVEDDEAGVCAGAAAAADAACGGAGSCVMGGGAGGDACSVSRTCDGSTEELRCDGSACTCVREGEPGEGCADVGVCALDLEAQIAAAQACCGWDWS